MNNIFSTPKNFKRGKYIFNRFRVSDAAIILVTIILSILSIILYLNLFQQQNMLLNLIVVIVLLLPILIVYILFLPLPVYFNVLDYLKVFFAFYKKQKIWKWEGVYQFESKDEYEEEQEES